jgi:hypothetical protein
MIWHSVSTWQTTACYIAERTAPISPRCFSPKSHSETLRNIVEDNGHVPGLQRSRQEQYAAVKRRARGDALCCIVISEEKLLTTQKVQTTARQQRTQITQQTLTTQAIANRDNTDNSQYWQLRQQTTQPAQTTQATANTFWTLSLSWYISIELSRSVWYMKAQPVPRFTPELSSSTSLRL